MRSLTPIILAMLLAATASATIQRTFVSRSGLDSNPCTVDSPCRSFAAAILQTNPNGEIVVNDSAGYGPVTITQAVAIVSPLGVHAAMSVFSADGVTVNAGSTDVVVLRNIYVNSQGGTNGITLTSAARLHIEHCVLNGFSNNDINLVPIVAAAVFISDTATRQAAQSGIYADSAQPLTVSIDHCRADANAVNGILVDRATAAINNTTADNNGMIGFYARGNGGPASMAIEASVVSNNFAGVRVDANSNATVHNSTALRNPTNYYANTGRMSVDHCVASGGTYGVLADVSSDVSVSACAIVDNLLYGVYVVSSSTVRLSGNTITRNLVGIQNPPVISGTIRSTGDNMVDGNGTNSSGTITPANKS